jgi:iron(III) transport system permease protein
MSRTTARFVLVATSAFFAVFFLWPVLQILRGAFVDADGRLTASYLVALLRDPIYTEALTNSFLLAAAGTVLAIAIAVPLAYAADRWDFPLKGLLGSAILVPMILPPFVGAMGLRQIFGDYGAFNSLLIALGIEPKGWAHDWFATNQFWGVAVTEAFSLYPIIYLNALAALANVDPAMEEAAQNLGCTGWRRFVRITLPLIQPGLFAGSTLVFIWIFTELGTPLVFDYARVTSVQIYYGLKDIGGNPFPYALVAILLVASTGIYALGKGVFGREAHAMMAKATSSGGPRRLPPSRAWLVTLLFGGITLVALLPHLGVALIAFAREWYGTVLPQAFTLDNYRAALSNDTTVPAIANSLGYAAVSTVVDVVLGVAIAYVVVRSRVAGRGFLDFLAMLPLAVPGVVLAFGYLAMAQEGRFFSFINPVKNPTVLLIVAYSVRRLPYMVRSAAAGFQQTSVALEEAAANMGSPPLRATLRITLPLITANLLAGGLLAFAFAMLEVSDSVVLAQKMTYFPVTKAILELFQLLGDGKFMACALGTWAMVFLAILIGAVSLLLGKRLGALFRV